MDEKKYKCTSCDASYCELKEREAHQTTKHKILKPYKCDQCQTAFTNKENLTRHIKGHNFENKKKCEICGREFVRSDNLQDHIKSAHNNQVFRCELCGLTYRWKLLL